LSPRKQGARLDKRDISGLDLELFHYVYDDRGPGSVLRQLFAYLPTWYGNQDVFTLMAREMPPVFQEDFAARQKARSMAVGKRVGVWDLTEFLVFKVVTSQVVMEVKSEGELNGEVE